MCFSNLPIEFDEQGNPALAEVADTVEDPGTHDHDEHAVDTDEVPTLDADPEAAYAEIMESVPESVHEEISDSHADFGCDDQRESARGD
jgi:hypothetical protein